MPGPPGKLKAEETHTTDHASRPTVIVRNIWSYAERLSQARDPLLLMSNEKSVS